MSLLVHTPGVAGLPSPMVSRSRDAVHDSFEGEAWDIDHLFVPHVASTTCFEAA